MKTASRPVTHESAQQRNLDIPFRIRDRSHHAATAAAAEAIAADLMAWNWLDLATVTDLYSEKRRRHGTLQMK